jgi:dihydrodipicolinate synthase/N-acetylneuraminate lyase
MLTEALFRETSPAPLKYALSLLGLMAPNVRLPLVELTEPSKTHVAAVLAQVCQISAEHVIGMMRQPMREPRRAAS